MRAAMFQFYDTIENYNLFIVVTKIHSFRKSGINAKITHAIAEFMPNMNWFWKQTAYYFAYASAQSLHTR